MASIPIGIWILSDKINQHSGFSAQVVEHKHLHIDHSAVNGLLSDNKTEGNTGKQRETDQQKTDQDTTNNDQRIIDIIPEKESKKESKRGGGGQQDSAALDT